MPSKQQLTSEDYDDGIRKSIATTVTRLGLLCTRPIIHNSGTLASQLAHCAVCCLGC